MERLADIMKKKGISQAELHRISGVSQSQIYDIIRGVKSPTLRTLNKISAALEVSIYELIGEKPKRKKTG